MNSIKKRQFQIYTLCIMLPIFALNNFIGFANSKFWLVVVLAVCFFLFLGLPCIERLQYKHYGLTTNLKERKDREKKLRSPIVRYLPGVQICAFLGLVVFLCSRDSYYHQLAYCIGLIAVVVLRSGLEEMFAWNKIKRKFKTRN